MNHTADFYSYLLRTMASDCIFEAKYVNIKKTWNVYYVPEVSKRQSLATAAVHDSTMHSVERKMIGSYQVIIRLDTEEFAEVPEGQWSIGLKPEVWVVMRRGEIATFTAVQSERRHRERALANSIPASNSSSISPELILSLGKTNTLCSWVSQWPMALG